MKNELSTVVCVE